MTVPSASQPDSPPLSLKTPAIKVIAIGGAGINLAEHLLNTGLSGVTFAAINTENRSLANSSAPEKVHLDTGHLRRLGAGGDPERSRVVAEEQFARLKSLCAGAEVVIILAGLGGGAGTGISPVLARAAKEAGALALVMAVMPFECEGSLRLQLAQVGVQRLHQTADLVFCLPNQKCFAVLGEGVSVLETYKAANQLFALCLRGIGLALATEMVMGLPFPDLCALIRERAPACLWLVVEASGANRALDAVHSLLSHPLLGPLDALQQAAALGVCVMAGANLTTSDVSRVMEEIQRRCPDLPALMGAGITPAVGDKLLVGLLVPLSHAAPADESPLEPEKADPLPFSSSSPADLSAQLLDRARTRRPESRFLPPPPDLSREELEKMRAHTSRGRKAVPKLRQSQLPLEIVSKGRFDKSEPTIHKGEDLDVPTYIRRGVALN